MHTHLDTRHACLDAVVKVLSQNSCYLILGQVGHHQGYPTDQVHSYIAM